MKIKTAIAAMIATTIVGCGKDQVHASNQESLPKLNTIQTYTFKKPYSCGGDYQKSALFMSSYSRTVNAPDLLYNCNSEPYVDGSTAGDDFSLVSDLGEVALEDITPSKAFNFESRVGRDNTFKQDMPVQVGHSYSVLLSKSTIRALYVFEVDAIETDGSMKIRYAVKSYSIVQSSQEAPGFDWDAVNK